MYKEEKDTHPTGHAWKMDATLTWRWGRNAANHQSAYGWWWWSLAHGGGVLGVFPIVRVAIRFT